MCERRTTPDDRLLPHWVNGFWFPQLGCAQYYSILFNTTQYDIGDQDLRILEH